MKNGSEFPKKEFYSSEQLAKKLDVTLEWVKYNRTKSKTPIPHKRFSTFVRYDKEDVMAWIGRKDLELEFYSPRTLAKMLNLSLIWLKINRRSKNSIPFRRLGRIIRYNKTEVQSWLNKENKY